MSKVERTVNGQPVVKEARFHRLQLENNEPVVITAGDQPTAIWVSSGYTVMVLPQKGMVLDVSEVVQHEDIVSMDQKLREMKRAVRDSEQGERRARRRLRRGERPVDGDKPKGDEDGHGNRNRP